MSNVLYSLLTLFNAAIIGLIITTIQFTKLKDTSPTLLNNGDKPLEKIPNVTDDEIFDRLREIAKAKTSEPEVVEPTKQITVTQSKETFNNLAQEVLRQKIIASLGNADFKLNVKGSMNTQGEINFKKMDFGIKTNPQTPSKQPVPEEDSKKKQGLQRPKVN